MIPTGDHGIVLFVTLFLLLLLFFFFTKHILLRFSFYIILSGKISIYILNKDRDGGSGEGEEKDAFAAIGALTKDGDLDRSKLGNFVTSLGKLRNTSFATVSWRKKIIQMKRRNGYVTIMLYCPIVNQT